MKDAVPSACQNANNDQSNGQGQGPDCRPDLTKVAAALNITVEQLRSALGGAPKGQGGPDLSSAASKLGISVEALQQAMKDAVPSACQNTNNDQSNGQGQGPDCRPDLTKVAAALNITVEQLRSALGGAPKRQGGPDLTAAASKLGISVEALQQAMKDAVPSACQNANNDQSNGQGQGPDCRPDLTKVAASLNITVEQLRSALGGPKGQGQPPSAGQPDGTPPTP
jgi:ribosomal protein S19E (S16A)